MRWRLTDLAQLGDVTEQQIRNYLDAGLLPPAERAANNYRVFTDRHADAVRVLRVLAAGHGWRRARAILGAVHGGDIAGALAQVDDSHAELAGERATIAAARRAFAEAAGAPAPATRRSVRIGPLARDLGVRTPVLRLWERRGLLRPQRERGTGYRVFDPAEQRAAHLVAVLRAGNFSFAIIEAAIGAMRVSGSTAAAMAELSRRDEQVTERSRRRLAATAALNGYLTGVAGVETTQAQVG
jgi:DNA-binding transcriptional MerR regulator